MNGFVLGVDGGGTQTRVVAVGTNGHLLGTGTGSSSNYDDVGVDAAQAAIDQAVAGALAQAGLDRTGSQGIFLGLAGITSETDQEVVRTIARRLALAPADAIGVDHDCRVALAGGLEGRPGIVQIIGTGSSCYGRNASGAAWLAGGRGHLIADEGSGYWMGVEAMRAAVRAYDGRGPDTALLPHVLAALGIASIEEIMHRLYVAGMSRAEIATMGPLVVNAAEQGDEVAVGIVNRGMAEVADCVAAVARRLGLSDHGCEVCVVGGVAQSEFVFTIFCRAVAQVLPTATVKRPALPPVLGAALLALELAGIELRPPVLAKLHASQGKA
ncbi:MAG: ATPase [Caldilineaceae bacterium]|nr:ATPase [Caldilineaceae bacterium]